MISRRNFIQTGTIAGLGITSGRLLAGRGNANIGTRVGIIGLDTSHSIAFTKALNNQDERAEWGGFKVVAAYPQGSLDIKSSVERIAGYTEQVIKMGVEIVDSIEILLTKVDFVMLETNDGRRHLEQALPVLKAGKPLFIDKPMAASLADAISIFDTAARYNVPVFSTSSLRYIKGMQEIKGGAIGKIHGAEVFSPSSFEKTHPDFFWYGIHGVETLFTVMGTGCRTVVRASADETDVVVGIWADGRIGTFRGLRKEKRDYGGFVFGELEIRALGSYGGYDPLLMEIVKFFKTGVVPVKAEETLEILAFMEAADLSKKKGGIPVSVDKIMEKARRKSKKGLS